MAYGMIRFGDEAFHVPFSWCGLSLVINWNAGRSREEGGNDQQGGRVLRAGKCPETSGWCGQSGGKGQGGGGCRGRGEGKRGQSEGRGFTASLCRYNVTETLEG